VPNWSLHPFQSSLKASDTLRLAFNPTVLPWLQYANVYQQMQQRSVRIRQQQVATRPAIPGQGAIMVGPKNAVGPQPQAGTAVAATPSLFPTRPVSMEEQQRVAAERALVEQRERERKEREREIAEAKRREAEERRRIAEEQKQAKREAREAEERRKAEDREVKQRQKLERDMERKRMQAERAAAKEALKQQKAQERAQVRGLS
jgi:flagellar biosynthesis GTPase FlhF